MPTSECEQSAKFSQRPGNRPHLSVSFVLFCLKQMCVQHASYCILSQHVVCVYIYTVGSHVELCQHVILISILLIVLQIVQCFKPPVET